MDKVKVGIIGIGNMGTHHAKYLAEGKVPNAELTAVCDFDPQKLEWAKNNLPESVKKYESTDAFFAAKVCDAVMVATPHYDHPPLIIKAFENGMHALTEKPAGVYTKQVREMNEAAKKSGKVFGIMYNQRSIPLHQKARELVTSGELGEVKRTNWIVTDWFRSQSYYDSGGWRATWEGEGGGVLINQCPHNLDLWQWICGMPNRVRAFCKFGKYHNIEVEDDVTAYVEYENGATGLFITTTGEAPGTNRLEVTGDNGKMVMESGQLTFWRTTQPVSKFNKEYTGGFGAPEVWKCEIPVKGSGEQHLIVCQNWINAITKGSDLLAPGVEGINGLSISNAIHLSTWTDNWVDLPFDEDLFYTKLQEQIKNSTFKKEVSGKKLSVDGTF
ncbi:MAG: Gfo/Idh/MocA family oxidoreductase [Planctomycetes bacterium]|nr:Gfo/Idh/MocA family oxidoreductase [Planctomycetota bacterium]